ncbi:MAG: MFS transporter [Pseudomonadota bacterium]
MTDLGRARLGTCLVFFICGIGHGTWAPRLAEIKAGIGASDGELGLSLLMLGIGALIAMPVTGALVGRFGSKTVSFATAFAQGIVFPLMAFAWSWVTLGLAMFLYGVALGSLDVAMNVQATEIERKKGQSIMSSFHGVYSVGDMAGALATGLAASMLLGLQAHFMTSALILLLVGVGGCWMMIADEKTEPTSGHSFVLPSGILVVLGLIACAALLAEGSVGDWSAIYLHDYQGADTRTAAIALTVFAFAMAIMRFAGDHLVRRFGPFVILQASASLAAIGLSIALLTDLPSVAILGYGIAGLGIATLFPVLLSVAPRLSGMSASASVAAVATLGYGGFLVGPPLIGLLADQIGLPLALALVVVLLAATLPAIWFVGRRAASIGWLAAKA